MTTGAKSGRDGRMTTGARSGRDGRLTMRRAGFPLALALVVVTNAVALGGVLGNRRGEPDAVVTLTERELTIGYVGEEDTGLALHLDWNQRWDGSDPGWLDRGKLESLGFDCSVPPDDPRAELHYGKALPLQRYAVLEFEGEAWRRWLADQEREIEKLRGKVARHEERESSVMLREKELATARVANSRLMLVDVGRDPVVLRRLHPDRTRFIVAPAAIYIYFSSGWKSPDGTVHPPVLQGRVSEILVQEIHVPLSLRPILDRLRREDDKAADTAGKSLLERRFGPGRGQAPRYEVILKYGRRHEPWIAGIHRLS
jgi:Domain of unknown function (DUF4824)